MAKRKVLLVEGKDDEHVVKNLCGKYSGPRIDLIKAHEGVEPLLEAISTWIKQSAGEHIIGIVVDADGDIKARWQAIMAKLAAAGYQNLPALPAPDGTVIEVPPDSELSRIGIWIMPDNQTGGILEDFLYLLVPPESRLFAHVQASVDSIPQEEVRFSARVRPKALLHTWLAWQERPGVPFGTAINSGWLGARSAQVAAFVVWLHRLYADEPN